MSTIIFPSNPSDGQLFPPESIPGVKQYKWDEASSTWKIYSSGASEGIQLLVEPNSALKIEGNPEVKTLSTIYNTLVPDDQVSVQVGGASPTTALEWKSKNLVEVLDEILFPEMLPTYVTPTITLSFTQSGTKEVGESLIQVLGMVAKKNDSGGVTDLELNRNSTILLSVSDPSDFSETNLPDQFGFVNENVPNRRYYEEYEDEFEVTPGTTSWVSGITFLGGLPNRTSKGTLDTREPLLLSENAPQLAGIRLSNTASITGVYPFFWGKSAAPIESSDVQEVIQTGGSNKVLSSSTGTIQVTFEAASEYIWIAHPSSSPTKTRWYFTELNQGEISSSSFISPPVLQDVDSPEGLWSGVSYKIYISNYLSNTTGPLQLRNS